MSNSRSYIPAKGIRMRDFEMCASFDLLNNKSQITASFSASVSYKVKGKQYYNVVFGVGFNSNNTEYNRNKRERENEPNWDLNCSLGFWLCPVAGTARPFQASWLNACRKVEWIKNLRATDVTRFKMPETFLLAIKEFSKYNIQKSPLSEVPGA